MFDFCSSFSYFQCYKLKHIFFLSNLLQVINRAAVGISGGQFRSDSKSEWEKLAWEKLMSKASQVETLPVLVLVLKQIAWVCLDSHRGWCPSYCSVFFPPFYLLLFMTPLCSAILTGVCKSLQLHKPQQLNPDTDHTFLQNRFIVLALLVSCYCGMLLHFISVIRSGGR